MAKKNRYTKRPVKRARQGDNPTLARAAAEPRVKKLPPVYGPSFVLLEDENKNTFEYRRGAWVPYADKIAECRIDCEVKELAQKVNRMTRYEVRKQLNFGE